MISIVLIATCSIGILVASMPKDCKVKSIDSIAVTPRGWLILGLTVEINKVTIYKLRQRAMYNLQSIFQENSNDISHIFSFLFSSHS